MSYWQPVKSTNSTFPRKVIIMNQLDQAKELLSQWNNSENPNKSPGAVISIVQNGEAIFEHCVGMANIEHSIPITKETKFNIASCSKMFVASACIKLQQDGFININNPAIQYLDNLDISEDITIKHLLSMTSGIYEGYDLFPICGSFNDAYHAADDHIEILNSLKSSNGKAGNNFIYNNSNYIILARIIEKVTGKHLDDYLNETIWQPLGMNNTSGDEAASNININIASPYYKEHNKLTKGQICKTSLGNGHIISNLKDLKIWANILKNKNCNGINISSLFETTSTTDGTLQTYGMGIKTLKYHNINLYGHGGLWEAGYASSILYSPELDASIIILSNCSDINTRKISLNLIDIFFKEKITKIKADINTLPYPEHLLNHINGTWVNENSGEVIDLKYNDTILNLQLYDINTDLELQTNGSFTNDTLLTKISIIPKEENGEYKISINWGGKKEIFTNKNQLKPPSVHPQQYIGVYHNSDIDAQHHISINEGKLYARFGGIHNNSKKIELIPVTEDIYKASCYLNSTINEDYTIKFEREKFSDTISQIKISTERTKNLTLRKMKTF